MNLKFFLVKIWLCLTNQPSRNGGLTINLGSKMNYREKTHLARQVFSNTPDPLFFCECQGHVKCLENLSLSLGLRRGLSVVVGGVGTGKTILLRRLINMMSEDDRIALHLILDPFFRGPRDFWRTLYEKFHGGAPAPRDMDERRLKEAVKRRLYAEAVEKNKIVVLFIDEGQKMSQYCLEVIRDLLNLETNEYKLLQIVIAVQGECNQRTGLQANLADRIDFYGCLGPLDFHETRAMIRHRIETAMKGAKAKFFSTAAYWEIFRISGGYPSQIINLCHRCFLDLLLNNRRKVTRRLVRECAKAGYQVREEKRNAWRLMPALTGLVLALLVLNAFVGGDLRANRQDEPKQAALTTVKKKTPATMIESMRRQYAAQVLENEKGRLVTAGHDVDGSNDRLQIQSSSFSMGANPRRMVFSVTQTGSMN